LHMGTVAACGPAGERRRILNAAQVDGEIGFRRVATIRCFPHLAAGSMIATPLRVGCGGIADK
ncbi:MAG: hypothetical protein JJ992_12920, partial [Planctomycetes bacterium]|nr:hypothetical protein [Planctomycetota bacterium]